MLFKFLHNVAKMCRLLEAWAYIYCTYRSLIVGLRLYEYMYIYMFYCPLSNNTIHSSRAHINFTCTLNMQKCALTATQWPHFCTLCINLRHICNTFTQHIHGNVIAIFVFPIRSFIPRSLYLGTAVSCKTPMYFSI